MKIGMEDNQECSHCDTGEMETPQHLILECEGFNQDEKLQEQRNKFRGVPLNNIIWVTNQDDLKEAFRLLDVAQEAGIVW